MEKRIELERRGKKPEEITELILDNSRATQIEGLTDEYTSLESLSLINVGLTSMKGFPKLRSLKRLELSDNRINGGLDVLQGSPLLTQINISGNKIKDLTALEPLKTLECLTHLDLFNNPLSNEEDEFRAKVFKMLPNLAFLDGTDADDMEDEEDSEFEDNLNMLENNIQNPERAGTPPGGSSGAKIGSNSSGGKNGNAATAEEEDDEDDEELGEEEEEGDEEGEDEEDEDEEEDGEEEEEEEEDDGPGLADIYKDNIEDGDGDDEDFDEAAEQAEPDDDVIEEDEETDEPSEKRRKTEGGKNA